MKQNIESLKNKASAIILPVDERKQVCKETLFFSWENIFMLFVVIPCKTLFFYKLMISQYKNAFFDFMASFPAIEINPLDLRRLEKDKWTAFEVENFRVKFISGF